MRSRSKRLIPEDKQIDGINASDNDFLYFFVSQAFQSNVTDADQ